MKKCGYTSRRPRRWPFFLAGAILLVVAATLFLQVTVAHRKAPFRPDYPRENLSDLLTRPHLSTADYETLFLQTGLARLAVDTLRAQGAVGTAQIVSIQDSFFAAFEPECVALFSFFTMEDRMRSQSGASVYGPPLPALQNGDVLITYSTHSFGWRHGHAAIVVAAAQGLTLEAAVIGTDSQYLDTGHWRQYSDFIVLRLRDITPEQQDTVAGYAMQSLSGIPYRLTSGLLGAKASEVESALFGVQCSYLAWYAYQHLGYDVDADGGALVTVHDLATSPLFEVVQLYGHDPRDWNH